MLGEKFGRGVGTFELRHLVKIAIVEWCQRRLKRFVRAPDIDDDAVRIERFGEEGCVDDECRAMQRLRRTENDATERMGDHDVVADFDGKQKDPPTNTI